MKCVGIQYLEAIRKLRQNGVVPVRTVHVTFVPDEQVGSEEGMKLFVKHEDFRNLNIAFAMDEGLASEDGVYRVYNAERSPWCKILLLSIIFIIIIIIMN
ncbi:aminoacylase-1-like, partial [Lingula anatina]|uniref:Aminoacylase-1-like n=1 Tax=Lingula anatina TaxID=7574 RepID=A0A1S3IUS7_LINAN